MEKKPYVCSPDDIFREYITDPEKGISSEEAKRRLLNDGYNEFAKKKHSSLWQKFIGQFKSFMIIVLLIASIISGITGYMNGEGIADALIILVILIANAIIGVFQENKAEKALDALEKMSAPHCKVVRDGEVQIIESRNLVTGDIVIIETGDSIPADIRLIESSNLKVQEAALTGESIPVEKEAEATVPDDAPIGDRINMAYASCNVTYGHGKGVVVAVGDNSEVGKIAAMIQSVPETRTPMQIRLDKLGKTLSVICLAVCLVVLIIGICYGRGIMEMFMTAVSLAVAAIPEGLPAVATVVLALGVQRLAKHNAIVRNLPSVETLGSTTVICSDKTGTLTQNRMTVTETYGRCEDMVKVAVLANDAVLCDNGTSVGDPTETALLEMGVKEGIIKSELEVSLPRIAEVPFDSERKRMSTVHAVQKNDFLIAVKGGTDEILEVCSRIYDNGIVRDITNDDIIRIKETNINMASKALRVLAMAKKNTDKLPEEICAESIENNLTFLGIAGMIDPPREEARAAVTLCRNACIKPVMITGDHKITAVAIAKSLGIIKDNETVLTGSDIETMDDAALRKAAENAAVFARVAPEHKVRIVKAYQDMGNIVAMTGDGVNDAPALKLADIGVAMGITGTDVSKEAADVVLADDNFATIVSSVEEGRRIYDNLMKSIQFMISTNFGEIILLTIAVSFNMDLPLLPIQLLFINLVGDSLPSLALSVDPAEKDIMKRKPVDPKQGIFTKRFTSDMIVRAIIIGGITLCAYLIGCRSSLDTGRTMAFAVMIFSQFTLIFSIRSGREMFWNKFFSNKWLWLTIILVISLTLIVMLVPGIQGLFRLSTLGCMQWLAVVGLSAGALVLSELHKVLTR